MDGVEGFGVGMLCNRNMKTPYPCYIMDLSYKIFLCFRKNMKERHTTIMQSTIFQTIMTRKPVHENDMIGFFSERKTSCH